MKIVRTDRELETPYLDNALREMGHELVLLPDGITEQELCHALRDCELLLMCYTPIPARVIEAAPLLRGIVKYGVGIDAIDIPAAHSRNIPVVNIPEYAEETVAEGAFALLISLAKRLPAITGAVQKESWIWPESPWLGHDLSGKVLGIIGCGNIGSSMGRMASKGFNMKVVGYDPGKSEEYFSNHGIKKYHDVVSMLSICDFVSLHAVLNASNREMIGEEELSAMKSTAFLINTARGGLVDEMALLAALKNKRLAGAALDVFSQEPMNKQTHPLRELYGMENVILFPHLTFYTSEAMERLEKETLERCLEIIENRPIFIKSKDPRLQR